MSHLTSQRDFLVEEHEFVGEVLEALIRGDHLEFEELMTLQWYHELADLDIQAPQRKGVAA